MREVRAGGLPARMRQAVMVLAAAVLLAACASLVGERPAQAGPEPVTFSLANGLDVIVVEDNRAPTVTHMVWYRIGGADEPKGLSGMAHFLEHLLFRGTPSMPGNAFSLEMARNGADQNAFTSRDVTVYHQRIEASRLPLVMRLEADRMENAAISEEIVETERKIILEERRMRVDNQPLGRFFEEVLAALYPGHPYGTPVIGHERDIRAVSHADLVAFYQRYYAPGNATLVVVGDVKADEVRRLAEDTYGRVPARAVERPARPAMQASVNGVRLEREVPRLREPRLLRYWLVPGYTETTLREAAALALLGDVIAGSAASRLYRSLVVDRPIALGIAAGYDGSSLARGTFVISATPRGETTPEVLEREIDAVLAAIVAEGFTDAEVERARTLALANEIYGRDSQMGTAEVYGETASLGLDVASVLAWPAALQEVTRADIEAAARGLFVPGSGLVAIARPVPGTEAEGRPDDSMLPTTTTHQR